MHVAKLAVVFTLASCVPVPDFVGVRDASPDGGGGDDAMADAVAPVPIEVHLTTRDGFATPVGDAPIVAVDPSGTSRATTTDAMGLATIEIIPGGTLYAVQPLSSNAGHQLVALFDVQPGARIELGEPDGKRDIQHAVTFSSGTVPNAIVYIASTSCGEQQSSVPPVVVMIDDRCPTNYEALYIAEGTNGFLGYLHLPSLPSASTSHVLGTSFAPPVDATITFDGFVNMAVAGTFAMIGQTGVPLARRGFPITGTAPTRTAQIKLAAPTTGFLIEGTITSSTREQKIVIDGTIGTQTNVTVSDNLLGPFVGSAALGAAKLVQWSQTPGDAQLLVVEGEIATHPTTGKRMLWRFIKPATATASFQFPDLPAELADFDLAVGETPDFAVRLFKFPSQIRYADVMRSADRRITFATFYLDPQLRPTAWTERP